MIVGPAHAAELTLTQAATSSLQNNKGQRGTLFLGHQERLHLWLHVRRRHERVKRPLLSTLAFSLTASEEYGPPVAWLDAYAINVKSREQTLLNSNIANGGTQYGGVRCQNDAHAMEVPQCQRVPSGSWCY